MTPSGPSKSMPLGGRAAPAATAAAAAARAAAEAGRGPPPAPTAPPAAAARLEPAAEAAASRRAAAAAVRPAGAGPAPPAAPAAPASPNGPPSAATRGTERRPSSVARRAGEYAAPARSASIKARLLHCRAVTRVEDQPAEDCSGVGVHCCYQPRTGDERQRAQPVVGTRAGAQAEQKQLRLQLGRGKRGNSRNESAVLGSHRVHPRRRLKEVGRVAGSECRHAGGCGPRRGRRRGRRSPRALAATVAGAECLVGGEGAPPIAPPCRTEGALASATPRHPIRGRL